MTSINAENATNAINAAKNNQSDIPCLSGSLLGSPIATILVTVAHPVPVGAVRGVS